DPPQQTDQRRREPHRAHPQPRSCPGDRHSVDQLVNRLPRRSHDQRPAVDTALALALTERLEHALHAAGDGGIKLPQMHDPHGKESPTTPNDPTSQRSKRTRSNNWVKVAPTSWLGPL